MALLNNFYHAISTRQRILSRNVLKLLQCRRSLRFLSFYEIHPDELKIQKDDYRVMPAVTVFVEFFENFFLKRLKEAAD